MIQEYWYDIYDNNDGNLAYLNTDIPPQIMSSYEESFKASDVSEADMGDDYEQILNRFIGFLRQKGHVLNIVNRPENWINLQE
ncbi:hypothetical protein M5X00_23210 [Paenibacillus alvei]|uniref:Uncharacterized protein n=1 Tax=Paenibacillus alvei TaxID=44250 RepID=A0ABT4H2H7_PAEAL|nr:hypothetical protein [Paenibacillus alvei]EJW14315.1 hypothetical protein PAV_14c00080 [Paenibacillus alvei DSM 29]MCY9540569.1 hypothetical protein [Paenibacillus alvei]MCY9737313.1 hypothetical protein [Paenibacillus alvei]MCY9757151.1 hypothetical protein [Paenibacillus alvei]MCY9763145.1 hypothetical protein [Paenibacillus alvei]